MPNVAKLVHVKIIACSFRGIKITPPPNSIPTDERNATQRCLTGVTNAGNKKLLLMKLTYKSIRNTNSGGKCIQ